MSDIFGILNGQAIHWPIDAKLPYIGVAESKKDIVGLPISRSEAFAGIPPMTDPGQVGAIAHWGAVFKLFDDGTWKANAVCGSWHLE